MITKFDINSAIALYKHAFADCIDEGDYEDAIDYLIKFSNATYDTEFHLAMGMLYMMLTQESDENELLILAFREFMMYIQIHPESRVAYRNLLAVAILRHDPKSISEVSDWIKLRGQDVVGMVNELSDCGIDVFNDGGEYMDIESLFPFSDFGAIADTKYRSGNGVDFDSSSCGADAVDTSKPLSKVIKFRGNVNSDSGVLHNVDSDKIIKINNDDYNDDDINDDIDVGRLFDVMMQLTKNYDDTVDKAELGNEDDDDADLSFSDDSESREDLKAKMALRDGQKLCALRKFDEAIAILDTIGRKSGRVYYFSECVRANILIELDKYDEAQAALDRAYSVVPDGALVGTLQCGLYEIEKHCELIPEVLKRIDVTDFVDSEHVNRAMELALKYCSMEDKLSLAEEYLEEFNSFDIRKLYAQLLYNTGERAAAKRELYRLSRVLYDDFNAQYYYLMVKAGVEEMPVQCEMPQSVLGLMVDHLINIVRTDAFKSDDSIITSEPFRYSLETFLSLEFQNTRSVVKIMFDTVRIIVHDVRLEYFARNALVSPYVEPFVKGVLLGEILSIYNGETGFVAENSFCPISNETLPPLGDGYSSGYHMAYGIFAICKNAAIPKLIECAKRLIELTRDREFDERDIAYYLCNSVNADGGNDGKQNDPRLAYALGYTSKVQATAAYKSFCHRIDLLKQQKD